MDHDTGHIQHPSDSRPPTSGNTPAAASEDVDMRHSSSPDEGRDFLPDLMDVSDFSDSSSEFGSIHSAADVQIIMRAQDSEEDAAIPSTGNESSPTIPQSRLAAPRSNNRRTRVEDDEDEERDRRHPSQRVSDRSSDSSRSPSRSSSSSPSQSPPPTRVQTSRIRTTFNIPFTRLGIDQTDPLRFFQHMMPQQQSQQTNALNARSEPLSANSAAPRPSNLNATPNTLPTPQAPPPQPHGGFTLVIPLRLLLPRITVRFGNAHAAVSGNDNDMEQAEILPAFAEMLMRLGMLGAVFGGLPGEYEVDDPERARKLVDGLETVPVGLVRRLERVGGTDDEDGERDSMCAICWDQLLEDAGFGKPDSGKEPKSDDVGAEETACSSRSTSPSHSTSLSQDEAKERVYPKIVSLPCAHVFHADCLIPWFSRPRQTTCPTCRFNIDPENLTRNRRRRSAPRMPTSVPPTGATQPTQNNGQSGQPHTTDDNDNATQTSQNGNGGPGRPAGQFMFDQMRFPIVISGRPVFPFNGGPDNVGQGDGIMDQVRASIEERLRARAGQAPSQSLNGSSVDVPPPADGPTSASDSADNGPPTEPATPTSPQSPSQPNPRTRSNDEHTVTHSIVFGFDVVLGGPMMGGPPAEENGMDVDDGMVGDGNERDFMGMMMGELFGSRAEPGANPNAPGVQEQHGHNNANHAGQGNASDGAGARGAGGNRGGGEVPPGFPRFFNMNLGNGESLHIASGSGSTMSEAMAQMLSSMGVAVPQASGNGGPAQNATPNVGATNANTPPQENAASQNNDRAQTNGQDQNQSQGNTVVGNGGFFGGIGSMPMQLMAQLFGLSSPARVRRRDNQGENQSVEAAAPPAEAPQPSRAENAGPSNTQPPVPAPAPQGNNANANDDGAFLRFIRNMIGAVPAGVMMGALGPEDANAVPPNAHFGFPHAEPMQTNVPPSEKKQWSPPPAPGPTLRQRIEKREREAGLRCYDVSCGVGPSDEDPLISMTEEEMKQLTLRQANDDGSMEVGVRICPHTFHPSCLVSTERVALRGADAPFVGDEVEVSCSVCRAVGRVSRNEWEKGMQQLS